jgi:hypothetical protein
LFFLGYIRNKKKKEREKERNKQTNEQNFSEEKEGIATKQTSMFLVRITKD